MEKKRTEMPSGLFNTAAIFSMVLSCCAMLFIGTAGLLDTEENEGIDFQNDKKEMARWESLTSMEGLAIRASVLGKSAFVDEAGSAMTLQKLFEESNYRLDKVRSRGKVPRLFLATLPEDMLSLRRTEHRKVTFIKAILPLILLANELILEDRRKIVSLRLKKTSQKVISESDRRWLANITKRYDLDKIDFDALLLRVDVIPPSLAIAQAAEESGWGTSRFAREGNALFGQRIYTNKKKGLIPARRSAKQNFRVRMFDTLIDGVKAYMHNLNSHFSYAEFRKKRGQLRTAHAVVNGYRLTSALKPYSELGSNYITRVRRIMRGNDLHVYDSSSLDNFITFFKQKSGV